MRPLSSLPTAADLVLGSLQAPLLIVEYGDYDCPHTRAAHRVLSELLGERPGELALVFRFFPLRHIHENAQQLAEWMAAIEDGERFWAAHELMMHSRRMSLAIATDQLAQASVKVKDLEGRAMAARARVEADVQRGLADGVHSTPSFFFNGAPHDGHYDLETLREQLARAPERA